MNEKKYSSGYAYRVYSVLKDDTKGLDSVFEDYIQYLVGEAGLIALKEWRLIETCGVIDGRQLYALINA